MNINQKTLLIQKQKSLKTKMVSNVSKCFQNALKNKDLDSIDSMLKSAVTSAVKNFEIATRLLS